MDASKLRRGWTTGACATAATKAGLEALTTGEFPDPVQITLPGGQTPSFALVFDEYDGTRARAGIVKDAGDDPDVTHGATIISQVEYGQPGQGVTFHAGEGVGTVTLPGLPLAVGEPSINPVPRKMMTQIVEDWANANGCGADIRITISVPDGEEIAKKTWNPRLGILGGLSILGTTGIVVPFSCSAWIHSIHRGIDVARAAGLKHIAGATGSSSEASVQAHYGLADLALIDMGDFVGGLLKYVKKHPVDRLTIAGGIGKLTKLAQGAMDLHSGRSQVDFKFLASVMAELGANQKLQNEVLEANTALQVLELSADHGIPLADSIADRAKQKAIEKLANTDTRIDVLVMDRKGTIYGTTER